jgi:hypothetical protein
MILFSDPPSHAPRNFFFVLLDHLGLPLVSAQRLCNRVNHRHSDLIAARWYIYYLHPAQTSPLHPNELSFSFAQQPNLTLVAPAYFFFALIVLHNLHNSLCFSTAPSPPVTDHPHDFPFSFGERS